VSALLLKMDNKNVVEPEVRPVATEGQDNEKKEQGQGEPNGSQEEIKDSAEKKEEPAKANLSNFFVGSDSARYALRAAVLIEWHPSSGFSSSATNWTIP
jgi:hypothetical protein